MPINNRKPLKEENNLPVQQNAMPQMQEPAPQQEPNIMSAVNESPAAENNTMNGFNALGQVIGREEILKAGQTLLKYKTGKANLERRIVENQQWYKLRNWEQIHQKDGSSKKQVEPTSAWLMNFLENKVADSMDNFPMPNVNPREEGDKAEAKILSSIIPVILEHNDFEDVYEQVNRYKMQTGTGVYGVYWDSSKLNGLGDIAIRKVDILKLFWEPGIMDIQDSHNVFVVELVENEDLEKQYPQLQNKLGGSTLDVSKYVYDDTIDTSAKSAVVDWYYKKNVGGKTVLHYCKFVNDTVLYASENTPEYANRGWYDHGKYPFVFDVQFPVEGTPTGFGYLDIGKSAQEYIDKGNQAFMQNLLVNSTPRYFIRNDGSVNEAEYADLNNTLVHVDGALGSDSVVPISTTALPPVYQKILVSKIDELKEVTGNRDVSTGGSASGVTAASAIAAMQEAGSKLSRKDGKSAYRAFRKIVLLVIELIRQFYDLPRQFRIVGESGKQEFVQYSNAGIQPQMQGNDFGMDMGYRLPVFDIDVSAEKQSPYSKMSQNELALQFFNAGFFNPQMTDQALACLEMMDFNRKEFIMNRIQMNGTMFQQLQVMQQQMLQMASMIDADRGTNLADQMASGIMGTPAPAMNAGGNPASLPAESQESSITKNARERVANSTNPT